MKDEYAKVGVPMLPVVRGERETRRQILLYSGLLVAVTFLPFAGRLFDGVYAVAAGVLGAVFLAFALRLQRRPLPDGGSDRKAALRLYLYSLLYLALLFVAMVADVKL
jgi:protoheme IX farnesyltransferase